MYLERLSKNGMESSPYYQSSTFNKAKGTITDLPNCTCYCMCATFERLSVDKPFAMFAGCSAGGYPNAKYWYSRTAFATGTELKEGSIAVFDGNCGHVAFVERVIDKTHAIISQSQYDSDKSLRNYKYWEKREAELVVGKATLSGIGKLLGFIYLPINDIRTDANPTKDQITIYEDMVNVRIAPEGEPFATGCYAPMGTYDVLEVKEVNGWEWYKLEENHWVRDGDWLLFFPKKETDSDLEKEIAELKLENERLTDELNVANSQLDEIRKIVC